MENFVRQQNIRLLRQALDNETDPEKRRMLESLLAEQEKKPVDAGETRPSKSNIA